MSYHATFIDCCIKEWWQLTSVHELTFLVIFMPNKFMYMIYYMVRIMLHCGVGC